MAAPPDDRLLPDELRDPDLVTDTSVLRAKIDAAFPHNPSPLRADDKIPYIRPASKDVMDSLLESFDESELDSVERSERFKQVSPDELREIIDWIRANPRLTESQMIVVSRGEKSASEPMPSPDITLSPTHVAPTHVRSLEESWVLVDSQDPYASLFVKTNEAALQQKRSFFHHWPSFHVGSKMSWVLSAAGTAFLFGYLTGAKAALDSLYRLAQRPFAFAGAAGGAAVLTGFTTAFAPEIALTALKYIVIGGLFGGAAVATPVFVVGTAGVFVASAVYHSFETTKRLGKIAVGGNK